MFGLFSKQSKMSLLFGAANLICVQAVSIFRTEDVSADTAFVQVSNVFDDLTTIYGQSKLKQDDIKDIINAVRHEGLLDNVRVNQKKGGSHVVLHGGDRTFTIVLQHKNSHLPFARVFLTKLHECLQSIPASLQSTPARVQRTPARTTPIRQKKRSKH